MPISKVENPIPLFADKSGAPLNNGSIFIGEVNLNPIANQIPVFWDSALTQPVPQPIKTINGYFSRNGAPANIYVDGRFSISVYTTKGELVYYEKDSQAGGAFEVLKVFEGQNGASLIGFVQSGNGAVPRTVQDELRDHVNIKQFGGIGDNATNNALAFYNADAKGLPIYLQPGIYLIDGYLPTGMYFGSGEIRLANVTGFGGKSLAFTYSFDESVPSGISGYVMDYASGALKEQTYNVRIGADVAPNAKQNEGMVVAIGGRAMEFSGTGDASSLRCTAVGANALRRADDPFSVTAIGDSACENGSDMNRLVAIGSNAMQFAGDTQPQNHFHEFHYPPGSVDPYGLEGRSTKFRNDVGASGTPANLPTSSDDAQDSVALGRNALLHAVKVSDDVAVGYNAIAHGWNTSNNVAIGSNALRDGVTATNDVAVGHRSLELNQTGYQNTSIGAQAMALNVHSHSNTAIGYRAAYSLSGGSSTPSVASDAARQNIAIGAFSMENATSSVNNVAIGNASFKALSGVMQSVAVGVVAGEFLVSGGNNTFLGYAAGRQNVDGSSGTTRTNSTAVGFNAKVSGDNQVQLGDASTTTYVYGTVQNRSDARDKTDIVDTPEIFDEFIMRHRPVQGRWDMREDYIESDESGCVTYLEKDGSKKRKRLHNWFIAQEVDAISKELGVDFAGLQHHGIDGGCDVYYIGYDEYIPLIVAFAQKNRRLILELEERIKKLELSA